MIESMRPPRRRGADSERGLFAKLERTAKSLAAHSRLLTDVPPGGAGGSQGGNPRIVDTHHGTPEPLPPRPRRGKPRPHAPSDQLPLKLSDRGEDAKDQPAIRCAGVHALVQADEMNPERVELSQCVHEVPQRARESIVSIHEDRVELPPLGIGEQAIQRGAGFLRQWEIAEEFIATG